MLFFGKKEKIGGIIGYLKLGAFWDACSSTEKSLITQYYRNRLGAGKNSSPVEGNINYSSQSALSYLTCLIGWAVYDKKYSFADKIIEYAEKEVQHSTSSIDKHFYLQAVADYYYKRIGTKNNAMDKAIEYCHRDVELFPVYRTPLKKNIGELPRIMTFQRLVMLYEKQEKYIEAIEICKKAIKYNLSDSTKTGYNGRMERLQKKLQKNKAK